MDATIYLLLEGWRVLQIYYLTLRLLIIFSLKTPLTLC